MTNPCKRWYGYKHDWRKCWYSEWKGKPVRINAMLCGTKKCNGCGAITDGYAEKENWQPKIDNFTALEELEKQND